MKLCNILLPFVIGAGLSMAQQPANPPVGDPHTAAMSMTGCLTKGNAAGEYILTAEGKQTHLVSSHDLSKHLQHTVKVKGTHDKKQEKVVFRVDTLEHVSDSCE